jgi:hypothetical protein
MQACASGALLLAVCIGSAAAQRSGRAGQPPAISPALAQQAILAAEDGRIDLPDGLHTPAIDVLRAKLAEDLRILFELTRSTDPQTQVQAIRALGRYERREVITDLLRFLPVRHTRSETANALAQAFKGEPMPGDAGGQQVQAAFEALVQVGEIDRAAALCAA